MNDKGTTKYDEYKIDVMIGTSVVYILMIIMVGAGVICFDFLFKTSIREWLGNIL